jgi:tetratricopeptide (TPR) repeat protein
LLAIAIVTTVAAITVNHWRNEAVRERDRADNNFTMARQAVDNLFTRVSESTLLNQPGTQSIRLELLQQAGKYYEGFLAAENDENALNDQLAASQFRVGRIIEMIDSRREAIDVYDVVEQKQRSMLEETSDDAGRLHALSMTLNAKGRAFHEMQMIDEAMEQYDEARKLREQLVSIDRDHHEHNRLLANSYMNLGLIAQDRGDPDQADEFAKRAQEHRLERIDKGDDRPSLKADLGKGYFNIAVFALKRGQAERAKEALEKAVRIFEELKTYGAESGRDSENGDFDEIANLHRLGICYRLLGDVQFGDVTSDEADAWYASAKSHLERLVLQNPIVPQYQADLAGTLLNGAGRQRSREEIALARQSFQRASQILTGLWRRFGEPAYLRNAAVATRELALCQWQVGDTSSAQKTLDELIALLQQRDGNFSQELTAAEDAREQMSQAWEDHQRDEGI